MNGIVRVRYIIPQTIACTHMVEGILGSHIQIHRLNTSLYTLIATLTVTYVTVYDSMSVESGGVTG